MQKTSEQGVHGRCRHCPQNAAGPKTALKPLSRIRLKTEVGGEEEALRATTLAAIQPTSTRGLCKPTQPFAFPAESQEGIGSRGQQQLRIAPPKLQAEAEAFSGGNKCSLARRLHPAKLRNNRSALRTEWEDPRHQGGAGVEAGVWDGGAILHIPHQITLDFAVLAFVGCSSRMFSTGRKGAVSARCS